MKRKLWQEYSHHRVIKFLSLAEHKAWKAQDNASFQGWEILKKNQMKFTIMRVRKYTLPLQFMSISQNVSFRGLFHLAVDFSVPWTRGPHQAVISVLCMVEDYFWWPWRGISQVWKMQGARLGKHGKSLQADAPSVLPLIKKTKFKRHYDINRWFWKSNDRGQTFTFSQHWKMYQRQRVLDFQGKILSYSPWTHQYY